MTYTATRASSDNRTGLVKVGTGVVAGAVVVAIMLTAPNWAPQDDWQLPGLTITLAVAAIIVGIVGLEVRGLVIAAVFALIVGFLSINDGPLQPQVFHAYDQAAQMVVGYPICPQGSVLNAKHTACSKAKAVKPVKAKTGARG